MMSPSPKRAGRASEQISTVLSKYLTRWEDFHIIQSQGPPELAKYCVLRDGNCIVAKKHCWDIGIFGWNEIDYLEHSSKQCLCPSIKTQWNSNESVDQSSTDELTLSNRLNGCKKPLSRVMALLFTSLKIYCWLKKRVPFLKDFLIITWNFMSGELLRYLSLMIACLRILTNQLCFNFWLTLYELIRFEKQLLLLS